MSGSAQRGYEHQHVFTLIEGFMFLVDLTEGIVKLPLWQNLCADRGGKTERSWDFDT